MSRLMPDNSPSTVMKLRVKQGIFEFCTKNRYREGVSVKRSVKA